MLVPFGAAGARTITALQSGFIKALLLASKTPQLPVIRMVGQTVPAFPRGWFERMGKNGPVA